MLLIAQASPSQERETKNMTPSRLPRKLPKTSLRVQTNLGNQIKMESLTRKTPNIRKSDQIKVAN
jgi:hypothetical protein